MKIFSEDMMHEKPGGKIAIVILSTLLSISTCFAYTHGGIALTTTVMEKNGMLTGLKMQWTMDDVTAAAILNDAKNAPPESQVWKKLAAKAMTTVTSQHYYTELWHNHQKMGFKPVSPEYNLVKIGEDAVLTFVLPLKSPQPLKGQHYSFSTFEPSYSIVMNYKRPDDIILPEQLVGKCNVRISTPQPSNEMLADALALEKNEEQVNITIPGKVDLGRQFSQRVTIECA